MKKQKLKHHLRECGCTIESHSQGESFQEAGNFILGKWGKTTFVVESLADSELRLRVNQCANWRSYSPPCRACSRFMGFEVSFETITGFMPVEQCFIWRPSSVDNQQE